MTNLMDKQREIEDVRLLLHELVIAKNGDMMDSEVAAMSIRLDKLIVDYERAKQKGKGKTC